MRNRAEILFSEVSNVLHQISEQVSGHVLQEGGIRLRDFRHLIAELKGMLQKEKEEFEVGDLRLIALLQLLSSHPSPSPQKSVPKSLG